MDAFIFGFMFAFGVVVFLIVAAVTVFVLMIFGALIVGFVRRAALAIQMRKEKQ